MTSTASFPIAAALLIGTLLAGCGRSSGEDVTHREARRAEQPADCKRANGFQKCGHQTELQAAATRSRIAFVRCMRTHGVRNFPYPTATGHVSVEMVRARGINPQSPAVARVVSECLPPSLRPPIGP